MERKYMKTSKTTLQKTDVDGKKPVKRMEKDAPSSVKAIVMSAIGIVLVIAMVVGMCIENFKPKTIMTIDGDKVTMKDAMYYLYTTEAQGNYMDMMYRSYGSSYWDMQDQTTGQTYRESAKTQAQSTIQQYEILYKEAVKAGYKVNSEDKKSAQKDVKQIRSNLSFEQKNKTGMTKGALTKAIEKKYCADRYKQDIIDGFDIDDQKIRDGVKKADFRQYDVQYYTISTKTQDKEGKTVDVDDETKKLYKAELEELAKRAKTEDFDSLTPNAVEVTKEAKASAEPEDKKDDKKKDKKEETKYYSTFNAEGKFVAGDGTFTTKVEKVLKKMDNDQISDVIEGEDAYYLVKMVNNNDDEAYENEVKNQISTEENNQFNTWYSDVESKHKVKIVQKEWDGITMGSIIA